MRLRYRYRLDPNPAQRRALVRAFGCARVVYNDGLRLRQDAHKAGLPLISDTELQHRVLTLAKRTPERAWLGDVSAVILQQSLADLSRAYRNWFADLKRVKAARARGEQAKLKVRKPRFKSRRHDQAVRFTRNSRFRVLPDGRLSLPKIGEVRVRWSRSLPCDPSSVTVTLDGAGRFHASFVVEIAAPSLPPADTAVGVDLGLTTFAARRDFHHQLSTRLVREYQTVCMETLNVLALGRSKLAKSIHDASWCQFTRMLEYKARLYGRTLVKVDPWYPSSQVCSGCGRRDGPKPLKVRSWTCPNCGAAHDRDLNAARNILAAGLAVAACGGHVSPGAIPAAAVEAGTTLSGAA